MKQRNHSSSLSVAQLDIMNVVWDLGEATVADVRRELAAHRELARNTVLTMMTRLAERGWLRRRAQGNTYLYSAAKPRRETLARIAKRLVDTAFQGSAEGLMLALLDGDVLSPQEADRIRKMIDEAIRKEGKNS